MQLGVYVNEAGASASQSTIDAAFAALPTIDTSSATIQPEQTIQVGQIARFELPVDGAPYTIIQDSLLASVADDDLDDTTAPSLDLFGLWAGKTQVIVEDANGAYYTLPIDISDTMIRSYPNTKTFVAKETHNFASILSLEPTVDNTIPGDLLLCT